MHSMLGCNYSYVLQQGEGQRGQSNMTSSHNLDTSSFEWKVVSRKLDEVDTVEILEGMIELI